MTEQARPSHRPHEFTLSFILERSSLQTGCSFPLLSTACRHAAVKFHTLSHLSDLGERTFTALNAHPFRRARVVALRLKEGVNSQSLLVHFMQDGSNGGGAPARHRIEHIFFEPERDQSRLPTGEVRFSLHIILLCICLRTGSRGVQPSSQAR